MGRHQRNEKRPRHQWAIRSISVFVLGALFFMVVPVWTAAAAGIASLSIVIFGVPLALLVPICAVRPRTDRLLVYAGVTVALFGLIVPQLAFTKTARDANLSLGFHPLAYITFSGATDIQPDSFSQYKRVGSHPLEVAFYDTGSQDAEPAVILLHGGGWRYGNFLETGQWPSVLTQAGFKVFSIQYRLSDDTRHTWRDAPQDVADAVAYIKQRASSYAVDPKKLTLMGQSAGGHLALLEAYRHEQVRSVVALYAPIDLELDYRSSRDKTAELDFIGGPPGQYPERYRMLSPVSYLDSDEPHTLLIQGTTDDLVSKENALRFSELLAQQNISHEVLLLPLTGHSFENQRGGFATQLSTQAVLRFTAN